MTVNYIGSIDNRHEVTEYTLSTGTKIVLSKEEVEEFVFKAYMLEIIEEQQDKEARNACNQTQEIKENQMSKEIYIVYVTHLNTVEQMYAYTSLEDAEAQCLELNKLWVNEDSFNEYIADNKITQLNLETFYNYYLEIEDDSYVGINKVVLES